MSDASANPAGHGGDKRALQTYKLRLRDKHAAEFRRWIKRDANALRNILARGQPSLGGGAHV